MRYGLLAQCIIAMIWLCMKHTSNVHNIYTSNIGSQNTKNTYDFLVQVWNFLLPLSLKVLRHKERDTHSFYSGFFICTPSHAPPVQGLWQAVKANCLLPRQDSTLLTFFKFPKSSAHIQCVMSFALASPISHLGLLWHLWVTCPLCVRVNTCVNVAPK